jgi:hypothetical protein
MSVRSCALVSLAGACLLAASFAQAQTPNPNVATIEYVPANSGPQPPAGMNATCTPHPGTGAQDKTCPVVRYKGITTWAYSFNDNRVALALVSYDGQNKIVRNVQKNGLRYVSNMVSSAKDQSVLFVGQSEGWVIVPWTQLGP